jgi:HSP20 family molecular chaperone IbpA
MFKIPVHNQKDMASIIESIVEGFGQNTELSDIFNDFQSKSANQPKHTPAPPGPPKISKMFNTLLDVIGKPDPSSEYQYEMTETADNVIVSIDMPGVKKESIVISYDSSNVLNVECERKPAADQAVSIVVARTVEYGIKSLKLHLKNGSSTVGPADIVASYNDGVLVITVPKENNKKNTNFIHVQ